MYVCSRRFPSVGTGLEDEMFTVGSTRSTVNNGVANTNLRH